ncbi:MAG: phosphoribosylformylglycinamidine synthase subunit PurQ, partial [Clostridia bacterium]|nr:phosphoribosylformylglycinamidine synthase subunit PurQ [Clostridia bacterium]
KMAMGNKIGFSYNESLTNDDIFGYNYGAFILELTEDVAVGEALGCTTEEYAISYGAEKICMCELEDLYENKLESIFKCNIKTEAKPIEKYEYKCTDVKKASVSVAKPKVLIPVFPGTNCEYDSAKAFTKAGAEAEIFVINNLSASSFTESVKNFAEKVSKSQIIFVPGGFSGGDEPDGSGKFITAFFRNAEIKEAVTDLLDNRDGLMGGICNGFQALIKLGLVPYGKIIDTDENCPTLTFNTISRHQSKLVRTRVASNKSPWLANASVGDIYTVPISHGEGRFIGDEKLIEELGKNGQIITQYVDLEGNPTFDIQYNPNGSYAAIEGITSPDGRVFGKMGHSERIGEDLYKNVEGNYDMGLFKSAVEYYK